METVPTANASVKNSTDKLRMDVMLDVVICEGQLDVGAVTVNS